MAVTDAEDIDPRPPRPGVVARTRAWLASESGVTQRVAGMAFVIRVSAAAIVFLSQIALARWMGGFEFGVYVSVWTWLLLAGDIVHLGFPLTAQRFIPEYTHHNDFDTLRGFLIGSRWLTFGLATAFAAAGACLVFALAPWLDSYTMLPFYLACASLPFYALSLMCDGLARSYNWIGLALAPHSLLRPAVLFALMAIAYFVGLPIDARTVMTAMALAIWSTSLLQLWMVDRRLATVVSSGPRRYEVRRWFGLSLPIIAMWSIYTMLAYADVLLLQQFRPPEDVAHYYAAVKTLMLVGFIHFSVSAAVAHRFTALHVAGERDKLAAFVAKSVRWTFWPSLAATLVMLALGRPLLWLFGPAFTVGYPYMLILAVGLMARAAVGPAERLLNMLNEQRICAVIYAIAFAANAGVCIMLAPQFGGMGAAIATSAAIVLESAMLFSAARRRLSLHLFVWKPRR
ncbi:MAG: lipopolysaccharide biosynthesis protein [Xanthobacteraceae bacterium]|nr:lipopolysaccharide biosynthesis protein [Xanthobacteraceae bacterium]